MKTSLIACLPIVLTGLLAQAAHAAESAPPDTLKSGKQVYNDVCMACHKSGVAHAPKFGNKADWAPLIEEGQAILTAHAWVGVRAMPAKGGKPDLKLAEFARAVAYMASESGGNWKDPDAGMMKKIRKEAEKRLEKSIKEAEAMKKELHRLNEEDD
jgi:cytochrome c5